jgi:hypothetical protein
MSARFELICAAPRLGTFSTESATSGHPLAGCTITGPAAASSATRRSIAAESPSVRNHAADNPVQARIQRSRRCRSSLAALTTTSRRRTKWPGSVATGRGRIDEIGVGEDVGEVEAAFTQESLAIDGQPASHQHITVVQVAV